MSRALRAPMRHAQVRSLSSEPAISAALRASITHRFAKEAQNARSRMTIP
jgi:hypothetical protein